VLPLAGGQPGGDKSANQQELGPRAGLNRVRSRRPRLGRRERAAVKEAGESAREALDTVWESDRAGATSGSESDPLLHEVWRDEEEGSDVEERHANMRLWLERRERFEDEWGEEALLDLDMEEEYLRCRREAGCDVPWGPEGATQGWRL
jgi:hypothetical protein